MATPTIARHACYVGNGNSETGNAFKLEIPDQNGTGANSLLIICARYPSGATLSSITDSGSNTWSTAPFQSVTDAGNSMKMAVFLLANAASITWFKFTFSAAVNGFKPALVEVYNVPTSSVTDGTGAAQLNTTGTVTSGSFNTAVNGSMVLQFIGTTDNGSSGLDGNLDGISKYTKGSGMTLLQTDLTDGYACQYQVQGTAGATNPSATVTFTAGAVTFPSITIAIKAGSGGTAPAAGPRVFGALHSRIIGSGGTGNLSYSWQFPTTGNAFVQTVSDPANSIKLVSVSGATSGAWSTVTASGFDAQACHIENATASTDEMLTVTLNDSSVHNYVQGITYDIVGAGAFDQSVVAVGSTTFGPGNSTPAVTLTPGVASGIVIAVAGINTGPPDSVVTPSGAQFLSATYTGESDLSYMDNGDFHSVFQYASNTAQSWVFHNTVSTSGFGMCLISIAAAAGGVAAEAGAVHEYTLPALRLGTPVSRLRGFYDQYPPTPTPVIDLFGEPQTTSPGLKLGTPISRLRGGWYDSVPTPTPVIDLEGEELVQFPSLRLGTPLSRLRGVYSDLPAATTTGVLNFFGASASSATVDTTGSPGFLNETGASSSVGLVSLSGGVGAFGASASVGLFDTSGSPAFVNAFGVSASVAIFPLSGGIGLIGASASAASLQLSGGIGLFGVSAAVASLELDGGISFNGASASSGVYTAIAVAANSIFLTGVAPSSGQFDLQSVSTGIVAYRRHRRHPHTPQGG